MTDFDDATLRPLYELSNALMAETYEHFAEHARTNDELTVFHHDGALAGFQFWRAFGENGTRYVLGGKLRIVPAARRRGLHLAAGLELLRRELAHGQPVVRLSIAALFGFVSIAKSLAHFEFIDGASPHAAILARLAADSDYRFDPVTGLVDVGIRMTDAQVAAYPPAYFETPIARQYIARNPAYRTNGCNLAFAFDADEANLSALARAADRG